MANNGYAEWKKNKAKQVSEGYREYALKRRAQEYPRLYNDWIGRVNASRDKYIKDAESRADIYQPSELFSGYANDTDAEIRALAQEGQKYREHFQKYGDLYGADMANKIRSGVDDVDSYLHDLSVGLGAERRYWEGFTDLEDFNTKRAAAEAAKKEAEEYAANKEKYKAYDFAAGEEKATYLKGIAERLADIASKERGDGNTLVGGGLPTFRERRETADREREVVYQELRSRYPELADYDLTELNNYIAQLGDEIEGGKSFLELDKFSNYGNPRSEYYDPNFEQYAKYDPSRLDRISYLNDGFNEKYDPYAIAYHYINSSEDVKHDIMNRYANANGGDTNINVIQMRDWLVDLNNMSEEQKKNFNYLYSYTPRYAIPRSGEKRRVERYTEYILPEIENIAEYKFGQAHPFLASLLSMAYTPLSGVEVVADTAKYLGNVLIDPNNAKIDSNSFAEDKGILGQGVSDTVDWNIGGWDAFDFLYNTGMSGVDSVVASFIPGGYMLLGLSEAANGVNDGLERGMSDGQALANGVFRGIFEAVFEKISIGNLDSMKPLTPKTLKQFGKEMVKSMGVNASEEALTELANITYDIIANGELSQLQQLVGSGKSYLEAIGELGLQVLESGASGALMGMGFSGAASGVNAAVNTFKQNKIGKGIVADGKAQDYISRGLEMPDTKAFKYAEAAKAKLDKGKSANVRIGKLAQNLSDSQMISSFRSQLGEKSGDIAETLTDLVKGREVSNKAIRSILQNETALSMLNESFGTSFTADSKVEDVNEGIKKGFETPKTERDKIVDTLKKNVDSKGVNAYADTIEALQRGEVVSDKEINAFLKNPQALAALNEITGEAFTKKSTTNTVRKAMVKDNMSRAGRAIEFGTTLDIGANGLKGLVSVANHSSGSMANIAQAYNAIYQAAKQGKAITDAKNPYLAELNAAQKLIAYEYGVMDSLEKKTSGEVLQKDSVGGTIKENIQEDANSGQKHSKRANEKELSPDRGTESGTIESESGTRTENEDRSRIQSEDGEVSADTGGTFTSNRGIDGINDNDDIPFDSSDIVKVDKNNILYEPQQKIINEYGVECYIIKDSAWKAKGPDAPAGAYKGRVYMSGSFSGKLLATLVPHETTHIMKQLKYQPYLDFMDKVPDMLDRSSADINILIDWIAEHCGFDFFSMSMSEAMHFYDEMNAAIYGFYKSGMFESEGLADHVPNAFYDFDSYIAELDAIHEQFKRDMKAQRIESSNQIDYSGDPDVQQAKSDQASSSEWSAERINNGKVEKAKPISEIIEQLRHDFGINIIKGHVRGKGVLGQYSRKNHGIRTKIANDLPTVAHELGHALDQRYSLTDKSKLTKEMRSELINALGGLKDSYKQNLWVSEGFAEYIRRFLQNRDEAARSYPEFTKHFLNSLAKADRVLMDTFADEINAYYALDADTATSSIRLREEGVPDARTALEKAKDMGDGVYQAWVDANHGIRLFDEATGSNTYKLASNAAYSDAIAGQIITGDLTDANGQYVAPGLKAALEGVNIGDKKIYREFGEYLVLKHGPERLAEGMQIFADPRKNNASFMDKRVAEIESAHPEFKEAADRLYEFQKQFLKTWAVDTGLLPAEVAEKWAKRWSFYVPLNRAVGKAGTIGAKRGYANQNSTIRKATGSGLDIVHPVDNVINNIVKMVNAGVRNNVMLQITAQAETLGADASFLEKVPMPMKKKTADLTGVKAKLHNAFGAAGISELLAEVEEGRINSSDAELQTRMSQEDKTAGKITADFIDEVIRMQDKNRRSKRKKKICLPSPSHVKMIESLMKTIRNDFSAKGYEVWIDGTAADHLIRRHGEMGAADHSMSLREIRELIPWVINNADLGEFIRNSDGTLDLSNRYFNADGSKAPQIRLEKQIDGDTIYVSECVPDSVNKRIYITSAYIKKGSTDQLLNIAPASGTPQPTSKTSFDGSTTNNSISQVKENVNKKNSTNSESEKSDAWSKVDEIIESAIDDVLIQYGQGKAHGDVVTVLRNGKEEFWKINDALLLESLTNLSQKKMNGVMEAYAVVSRFMTSNITGNNIIWSIFSNFPRDLMTFFTYSKQKNPLKAFPAMGEAYLNKMTGGKVDTKNLPYIKEYYALGGGQTSAYTADVDLAKRARKKLRNTTMLQNAAYYANPLNVLSFVSETVESGPRIATYIMMRERGMSPQDAFYESQDITVNFKRGGRLSRELNKAVPFFNASVQGLDKFKRWVTCADVPKDQRAKAIVGRMTMYVAVSAALGALIYALNNGDDEDEENYRLLSNYTKNTYWNIPLGEGKYFAIPKPREIAVLSTFIETTCEYFGGNDYAYDEFGGYVADNFLPPFLSDFVTDGMDGALGSLGMIGVTSDLKANKDFLGRPIESAALEGYESQDRYTRRTSQIAYWFGQAAAELGLDWSPVQIDYFFSQTLGGYWKIQKALFPVGSENVDWTLGVQNTYVKDNQYSNDIVNWMYDKATSSSQSAKSHPEDTEVAIEAKLDSNMKSFYSRYYALTKGQKEDSASRRAKRAVLDMIVEYRKATDNGDRSASEKVVYDIVSKYKDTSLLPSVMQSTVKDSEKREIKFTDVQYVEYQTTYDALYWNYVEDNLDINASDAEKIAIIKQAKSIAKERATELAIKTADGGSSGFFDKYSGIDDNDLIMFEAQVDISNDEDNSTTQAEIIEIIEQMIEDGLSKEDAYILFKSKYPKSDKNNPWRRYAP